MKGIILAGGSGTRLFPLTKIQNKHLIPVYNDLMIMYPLRTLIDAGITEIMIVAGKGFAGQFLELLGDGSEFGVQLNYTVQEKPAGIAHAIGLAKRFVNGENFVAILGDNLFEDQFDFSDFREGSRIYIKKIENPQRFGVVRLRTNMTSIFKEMKDEIIEIVEKPKLEETDNELIDRNRYGYAVTGLYIYSSDVFDKIKCLKPSNRGELEISDVNNIFIKDGNMDYRIVDGFWSDAGTIDSLFTTSEFVRRKELNL